MQFNSAGCGPSLTGPRELKNIPDAQPKHLGSSAQSGEVIFVQPLEGGISEAP